MKKILLLIGLLIWHNSNAQIVPGSPGANTSNKSYFPAQAVPTDFRTYVYDATNFRMRAYVSTAEVLTYLNLSKYRTGQFPIVVNTGGVLSAGIITGGTNDIYYFKDGTADANLVLMIPPTGACPLCLLASNNLSDLTNVATARTNLGLGAMAVLTSTAAGDLTGTWPTISVTQFNGQPPSFYLNYNNFSNLPVIPAQIVLTAGTGISVTGSYPNITITNTGVGFTTAGVDLIALSSTVIGLDTLNYRKVDSIWAPNDSTIIQKLNGVQYTLSVRGGSHGSGTGTGTVTLFSFVNANGVSGSVSNPSSIPALTITLGAITPSTVNGLTLTALATGFTIQGGTTSKTLTVPLDATVSGTNTGDVTLAGTPTYITIAGQVITRNLINLGTDVTGTLPAARFGALAGDVTTSAGSYATTIANNVVTNAKLAQMATLTLKGNNTGITANALDLTVAQVNAILPVFTVSLNGLVPKPTTSTGKVLSDNGTWVTNGAGSFNSHIGPGYWIDNGSSNVLKTFSAGYGTLIDSSVANTLTFKVDTSIIAVKGLDSIFFVSRGATGLGIGWANGSDTIYGKKLVAGANMTITQNADSSITFTSTGGGGSGITTVGTFDSQAPQANGSFISGVNIYFQSASATVPGMMNTAAQTIAGQKSYSAAPKFLTLLTLGGVFYGDGFGTLLQTTAGTSTQVLIGSTSPHFGSVDLSTMVGASVLPKANGGTGTATPNLVAGTNITITGTWPNQTISTVGVGTVTNVSASGGTTGIVLTVTNPTTTPNIVVSGTANVTAGGTGQASLTPYAVLAGGSTATGNVQQVSGLGTAGQVLMSNGAGFLPSWQNSSASALTFSNGLTLTGSTVTLEGTLTKNTTIANGAFTFTMTGSASGYVINGNATGANGGVSGTATNGGIAVSGSNNGSGDGGQFASVSGKGLTASTVTGSAAATFFVQPATTNTVIPVITSSRLSSSTPGNGIGGSWDLTAQATASNSVTNKIIWKLTDATTATVTSQFDFQTATAGASVQSAATIDGTNGVTSKGTQIGFVSNLSVTGMNIVGSNTGVLTQSGTNPLIVQNTSTTNNTITSGILIQRQSSAVPASGEGVKIEFDLANSTPASFVAGIITSKLTTVTAGSEVSEFDFQVANPGTFTTKFIISGPATLANATRFELAKGAIVSSAGDLTLGTDGNVFHISGTTTINAITTANWQAGSEIILIFDGSLTVKNNTAGGGGTAKMLLSGGVDFSATANDLLTLVWDGTSFFEKSRSVN